MSSLDHRDGTASVATWRCPACGTVQARASRCWRCSHATRTCRSCRWYEPSVATDLGICASGAQDVPVSAMDTRSCWKPAASAALENTAPDGLFGEVAEEPPRPAQPTPVVRTAPALRAAPDHGPRAAPEALLRTPKPRLQHAGRAAWVQPGDDRLVDAPAVEPAKSLTREVQRRRRRWFR